MIQKAAKKNKDSTSVVVASAVCVACILVNACKSTLSGMLHEEDERVFGNY